MTETTHVDTPVYREFRFHVQVVSDTVEVISLVRQILVAYPQVDQRVVAAWLRAECGDEHL